jgi:hypothetical protein
MPTGFVQNERRRVMNAASITASSLLERVQILVGIITRNTCYRIKSTIACALCFYHQDSAS